jgi:hypothetical protein
MLFGIITGLKARKRETGVKRIVPHIYTAIIFEGYIRVTTPYQQYPSFEVYSYITNAMLL